MKEDSLSWENIKNDWRSRLTSDTVTALMTIKLSEEAVDKYDPSRVSSIDNLEQNHMDLGVKMILLCKNLTKILIQTLVMNSKGQLLTTHCFIIIVYHAFIYPFHLSNITRKNIVWCIGYRCRWDTGGPISHLHIVQVTF